MKLSLVSKTVLTTALIPTIPTATYPGMKIKYLSKLTFFCQLARKTCRTVALALLVLAGTSLAQQTVSFRADNWYPYNSDPSDAKPGYVVEILKAVFEKDGGKVDYMIIPWKRATIEADKGDINGIIGAFKSDTPDYVFPEEPIGIGENTMFVKKGTAWTYSGVDSLKDKRLGIVNSYSYGDKVDEYIKQNHAKLQAVDESSGDNASGQAIRKLEAGRIDVFVEGKTVFWAQVAKMGLSKDDFVEAGQASVPEPLYVAFSPKKTESKALAAKLTAGIRELRKSGELAKILAKYEVKDWSK